MSYLVPGNPDGSRKDPALYSAGEKLSIASQIYHVQQVRHATGMEVDAGALRTAIQYAEGAEDSVLADMCSGLLSAPPVTPAAPGAKPFGKVRS